MNYKVLYRKYRPQNFDDVSGQNYTVKILKNAINNNKISHAYIFTGPRGTGKTSLAKIFAKSINCENSIDGNPCLKCNSCLNFKENPDIIEIDAASNNGVDEIRELINNVKLAPSNSKYKVYIIDEVHMLSQSAFNALLLTLEEPPSHVVFILATTDIQNVPVTILSRTQRFDFTRIRLEDIVERLSFVSKQENIDINEDAIKEIAHLSEGGLRDALSILDQVASQTVDKITVDNVINTCGTVSNIKIKKLIDNIEKNDINEVLKLLDEFKNSSLDSKVFINKLILVLKEKAIDIKLGKIQEKEFSFENIKKMIFELNYNINKIVGINPYAIIEMIILSYMNTQAVDNNELKQNNIEEITVNNNNFEEKNSQKEDNLQNIEKNLEEVKKIRVNNCFVNANKKDLEKVKNSWLKFVNKLPDENKSLYLCLADTTIAASSDKYFIILATSQSSAGLINTKLLEIENAFHEMENENYKIIALEIEEWNNAKAEYIKNKQNKVVYKLFEEQNLVVDDNKEINNIVNDIFMNKNVEIEKE